jgi:hypothetical protein
MDCKTWALNEIGLTHWIREMRPDRTLPWVSGLNLWSSPKQPVAGSGSVVLGFQNELARDDSHSENPTFHPTYQTDTTGQDFFQIRTSPTSPDQSDHLLPPHNPSVVGSIPTGPTTCPTTCPTT